MPFLWPLAVMFIFGGCQKVVLKTYPPFINSTNHPFLDKNGTPALLHDLKKVVEESGNAKVLLLDHGEDSLLLRVNLIRSARESISLQTFSWEFDEVGKLILWELIQANQKRGVNVRLLIDHMFNEHQADLVAYLTTLDPKFEIKYFNPSAKKLRPTFLDKVSSLAIDFHDHNARLHNKLLVVDDSFAITGGRNMNNHYYDQVIGLNYKDRDVFVVLPDPTEVSECINLYWESRQSVPTFELLDVNNRITSNNYSKSWDVSKFLEYSIFDELSILANDSDFLEKHFFKEMLNVESVEWVYDFPNKVDEAPLVISPVSERLLSLLKGAGNSVFIQSPYVVLSKDVQDAFSELRKAEKDLRIVISTNSLAATDNWVTYAANYKEKRIYLEELGLEMWEFKPVPLDIADMMNYEKVLSRLPFKRELKLKGISYFNDNEKDYFVTKYNNEKKSRKNHFLDTTPFLSLHAKSLVIDNRTSFVGSYNLDPRSDTYNTELGIIIHDHEFSNLLMKSILKDISPGNSYLIANKKDRPIVSTLNMFLYRISEAIPFIDPWPIRRHSSFELKMGREPVAPGHQDFFKNWKKVGNFPELSLFNQKQFSARIFKAMGMIFKPLL